MRIILSWVDCFIFWLRSIDLIRDLAYDLRALDILIGFIWVTGMVYFLGLFLVVDFRGLFSWETSR